MQTAAGEQEPPPQGVLPKHGGNRTLVAAVRSQRMRQQKEKDVGGPGCLLQLLRASGLQG